MCLGGYPVKIATAMRDNSDKVITFSYTPSDQPNTGLASIWNTKPANWDVCDQHSDLKPPSKFIRSSKPPSFRGEAIIRGGATNRGNIVHTQK